MNPIQSRTTFYDLSPPPSPADDILDRLDHVIALLEALLLTGEGVNHDR